MGADSPKAIFIKEIEVTDPDSKLPVDVEIYKDPASGAIFGIDSSFVDQVNETIPNMFADPKEGQAVIVLPTPEELQHERRQVHNLRGSAQAHPRERLG